MQTVQSPEFLELKELMGLSNNFSKYRRAVRDANPPLVPYLGRFLTDLNFVEDANKIRISANNHVNFRTLFNPTHILYSLIHTAAARSAGWSELDGLCAIAFSR
jgi:hypothetical protein